MNREREQQYRFDKPSTEDEGEELNCVISGTAEWKLFCICFVIEYLERHLFPLHSRRLWRGNYGNCLARARLRTILCNSLIKIRRISIDSNVKFQATQSRMTWQMSLVLSQPIFRLRNGPFDGVSWSVIDFNCTSAAIELAERVCMWIVWWFMDQRFSSHSFSIFHVFEMENKKRICVWKIATHIHVHFSLVPLQTSTTIKSDGWKY